MKKLTFVFICLFLVGCLSTRKLPELPPDIKPPQIEKGVANAVKTLDKSVGIAKAITNENEILANEITKTSKDNTIKRHSTKISGNSKQVITKLDEATKSIDELIELNYQLSLMNKYLKDIDKQHKQVLKQNKELRKELDKANKMLTDIAMKTDENFAVIMRILMGIGAAGIVAGVAMIAWGIYTKSGFINTGFLICAISIVVLSSAYFMGSNPIVVAIIGGISVIGIVIYLVILLYRHRAALEETVESMETVKKHGWKNGKEKINQSIFTREIVNEAKLKKKKIEDKKQKKALKND